MLIVIQGKGLGRIMFSLFDSQFICARLSQFGLQDSNEPQIHFPQASEDSIIRFVKK